MMTWSWERGALQETGVSTTNDQGLVACSPGVGVSGLEPGDTRYLGRHSMAGTTRTEQCLNRKVSTPEIIKWFIEDQASWRSYDLAPPPPSSPGIKGTQDWDFFWLRFWNLYYFFISYVKILRFYKKFFLIRPLLGEIRFFRLVWD